MLKTIPRHEFKMMKAMLKNYHEYLTEKNTDSIGGQGQWNIQLVKLGKEPSFVGLFEKTKTETKILFGFI